MPEISLSIAIECDEGRVFETLSDLSKYHQWLKPSITYRTVANISTKRPASGTTYIDSGRTISMVGEIIAFSPPHRIAFQQYATMKKIFINGTLSTTITYALTPIESGTRVDRIQQVQCDGSLRLFQSLILAAIRRENHRILQSLKKALEAR